jgi:hypothetical protein
MPEEARNRSITVYQNEPVEMIIKKEGGKIDMFIKEELFEYGSWLAVYKLARESGELTPTDWFLMIHDSCAFEKNTLQKINELCLLLTRTNIEFYSLSAFGFHNISLVRGLGVWLIAEYLSSLPKMTKDDAIALEGEGLFKILGNRVNRGEDSRGMEHCGVVWFASGKKSVVRIYSINLLKFYKVQDKNNAPDQINEDVAVHRPSPPGGDRPGDQSLCRVAA